MINIETKTIQATRLPTKVWPILSVQTKKGQYPIGYWPFFIWLRG